MYLSNSLVYNGALKCGNDDVANARLALPMPENSEKVSLGMIGNCLIILFCN